MQSSAFTTSYKWVLYGSGLVFFLFTLGFLAQVNVIHSNQIFVVSTGWQDKTSRIPTKHPDKSFVIEKVTPTDSSSIVVTDPEESTKPPATQSATDDESKSETKSKDSISSNKIKSSTSASVVIEDTDPLEVTKTPSSQSATDDESEISTTSQNRNIKSSNSSYSSSLAASRLLPYEYSASVAYQLDSMHSINVKSALRIASTAINALQSSSSASAPITIYLNKGNKIPIVLLTCNRPELLEQTIASLLHVKGIVKSNILISQDGSIQEVSEIAKKHGFALVQNTAGLRLRGAAAVDGSVAIAKHYKFSLDKAFDMFPFAPAVIIIEDDLLFSPDFLDYFESVCPIIDVDKSVMLISAWNDNGFKQRVKNPWGLLRTEFFPGLGWLLPRKLYETELQSTWPNEHWDHWLRSPLRHKGRNIVYPEIPRTYHNGIKGTFMNMDTHNKYFKDIDYNNDASISWSLPPRNQQINLPLLPSTTTTTTAIDTAADSIEADNNINNNNEVVIKGVRKKKRLKLPLYTQALEAVYDARIVDMISKCVHVNSVQDILTDTPALFCLWIDVAPDGGHSNSPPFEPIATFFHLWHEFQRGARRGVHEFHWQSGSYILLLNIHNSITGSTYTADSFDFNSDTSNSGNSGNNGNRKGGSFKYLFDPNIMRVIEPRMFDKRLLMEMTRKKIGLVGAAAESVNMNCHQVCASHGKSCRPDLLSLLNNCASLNAAFPCKDCHASYGTDQPAYVAINAEVQYHPGSCFYNSHEDVSNCEASHIATKRLCACS